MIGSISSAEPSRSLWSLGTRVRGKQGSTHGRSGRQTARSIEAGKGRGLIGTLRSQVKDRSFAAASCENGWIPKAGGKLRAGGRHIAAGWPGSLKLVLETIFEADFHPCLLRVPPETVR